MPLLLPKGFNYVYSVSYPKEINATILISKKGTGKTELAVVLN